MSQNALSTQAGLYNALKELALPRLRSTIRTKKILMDRITRDATRTDGSGKYARVPINLQPSEAIGARAENGTMPSAQFQRIKDLQVPYKYNYATIRVTHPSIAVSRNDQGAWAQVLGIEMDGIRRDLRNDYNRQLFGDGFGGLGTISSVSPSSSTLTMKSGHYVAANMVIDIGNGTAGGTLTDSELTVSSVSGNVVTMATTFDSGVTAADYLYRFGNANNEIAGLRMLVNNDTGTVHNINRTTYAEYQGQVLDAAGTTIASGYDSATIGLDKAVTDAMEFGEANTSVGVTDATIWNAIGNVMAANRRYTPVQTLAGGFKALEWAGVPIVWDRHCPRDEEQERQIFWLDMSTFLNVELADWDFIDDDGAILHRATDGGTLAAFDAILYYYSNLACVDPKANVRHRGWSD